MRRATPTAKATATAVDETSSIRFNRFGRSSQLALAYPTLAAGSSNAEATQKKAEKTNKSNRHGSTTSSARFSHARRSPHLAMHPHPQLVRLHEVLQHELHAIIHGAPLALVRGARVGQLIPGGVFSRSRTDHNRKERERGGGWRGGGTCIAVLEAGKGDWRTRKRASFFDHIGVYSDVQHRLVPKRFPPLERRNEGNEQRPKHKHTQTRCERSNSRESTGSPCRWTRLDLTRKRRSERWTKAQGLKNPV